jgi:tripartite-type tricarboxylate transporter receptor subunit TctC
VLVPFAAGGPTDSIARLVAGKLSDNTGKQFYIENQAGAGGNVGMGTAARATPDGLTLLCVSSSFVINPSLYRKIPYDPVKDFAPIINAGESPHIFVTHPSVPAKNMNELVALIKAKPGQFSYATAGIGTSPHLSGELLKLTYGLDLTHVPFRGAAPGMQSVAGGHIPIGAVALPAAVALVNAGQVNGLGLTALARFPSVPQVPTLAEQGIKDQEASTLQLFLAPAGTPKPIIDYLYREITKVVNGPGMRDRFIDLGYTAATTPPDEVAKLIPREVARWADVIKAAKVEQE